MTRTKKPYNDKFFTTNTSMASVTATGGCIGVGQEKHERHKEKTNLVCSAMPARRLHFAVDTLNYVV